MGLLAWYFIWNELFGKDDNKEYRIPKPKYTKKEALLNRKKCARLRVLAGFLSGIALMIAVVVLILFFRFL